ncbi:hypothetical protein DSO57_1015273 [Entomophthora muscae]|uniref:Uncharacterized protein n=1 Tax=Entomophthora muscae TaxID=34485 RepID=A0ACC2U4K5_9FUNG|nr:hypothetical protein DSO57_1015273 [Entomophthora muscae]
MSPFKFIALLASLLVHALPVQDITSSSSEAASLTNKNMFGFDGATGGVLAANFLKSSHETDSSRSQQINHAVDSYASSTIYENIYTNEITKSLDQKSQELSYSPGSGYTRSSSASDKSAKAYIQASKTGDFFINASHHNAALSAVFY